MQHVDLLCVRQEFFTLSCSYWYTGHFFLFHPAQCPQCHNNHLRSLLLYQCNYINKSNNSHNSMQLIVSLYSPTWLEKTEQEGKGGLAMPRLRGGLWRSWLYQPCPYNKKTQLWGKSASSTILKWHQLLDQLQRLQHRCWRCTKCTSCFHKTDPNSSNMWYFLLGKINVIYVLDYSLP